MLSYSAHDSASGPALCRFAPAGGAWRDPRSAEPMQDDRTAHQPPQKSLYFGAFALRDGQRMGIFMLRQSGKRQMHPSVIEFRERLFAHAREGLLPAPALRAEVLELHERIPDEQSRIELMRLFNLIADAVESHLGREGGNVGAFRFHRHGQIWQFLRAESLVDGVIDRVRLLYVTDREIAAGRLSETDEIRRYALGDEHAFDAYFTTH